MESLKKIEIYANPVSIKERCYNLQKIIAYEGLRGMQKFVALQVYDLEISWRGHLKYNKGVFDWYQL